MVQKTPRFTTHLAVQIGNNTIRAYETKCGLRVLSLIFGCITLVIVKLVQMLKEKNCQDPSGSTVQGSLCESGSWPRWEEAAQQIRRKNQFSNKSVPEERDTAPGGRSASGI